MCASVKKNASGLLRVIKKRGLTSGLLFVIHLVEIKLLPASAALDVILFTHTHTHTHTHAALDVILFNGQCK